MRLLIILIAIIAVSSACNMRSFRTEKISRTANVCISTLSKEKAAVVVSDHEAGEEQIAEEVPTNSLLAGFQTKLSIW